MKKRIEISGINATDFSQVFQSNRSPDMGAEAELQDGVKIVNLTSPTPNLIDANIFTLVIESTIELTTSILIGLITNYLYDILKDKKIKKITSAELPTKIRIDVKDSDGDEQA